MIPKLTDIERFFNDLLGVTYTHDEYSGDALLDAVGESKKRIYVVAGQLQPKFYSGKFSDALAEVHSNSPLIDVNILAHLNAQSLEEALKNLGQDNGPLVEVMQQIPNVGMYWAEQYPLYHFVIADDFLLLEEKHESGQPREVKVIVEGGNSVERYIAHFENMVGDQGVHQIGLDKVSR